LPRKIIRITEQQLLKWCNQLALLHICKAYILN
jgi:hypothetical protein